MPEGEPPPETIPPAAGFALLVEPAPLPAPPVLDIPVLPPPPILESPLAVIVLVVSVLYTIQPPPRIKKLPLHGEKEANKKVLKLSEAYKGIDKVLANKRIYLLMVGKVFQAMCHTFNRHFPAWLDAVEGAADFQEEIMEPISIALKNELWKRTLQQKNKRSLQTWKLKVRIGKLEAERDIR